MNKTELVEKVAHRTDTSKAGAARAVDAVFEAIAETLGAGETVTIAGFGAFSVMQRPARRGRNPRTGEAIELAPTRAPKFKAGKGLKDAVN